MTAISVFSPHSSWSDSDQSHWRWTLCKHLYQGHWRKTNHHQDNQSCWDGAKNHKSGRGRRTFNQQTNQGHWESTVYCAGHKSHWRQGSKTFGSIKMIHIWNGDWITRRFSPSRCRSWCRGKVAYRLVSLKPWRAWQLWRFFMHLLTSLLTIASCCH